MSGKYDPTAPARQRVYLNALSTLPEVRIHYGRFIAETAWRLLANLPVAGRQISTPDPVTPPSGQHPVLGEQRQMLPVGIYPNQHSNRRRATAPIADALIAEFHTMEEKGSDVNLAAYLLNDAWKASFDAAVVISNDTDLVTPICMVSNEQGKPVFVVCLGRWQIAPRLEKVASHVRHVRPAMLKAAQFPGRLIGTAISKPHGW